MKTSQYINQLNDYIKECIPFANRSEYFGHIITLIEVNTLHFLKELLLESSFINKCRVELDGNGELAFREINDIKGFNIRINPLHKYIHPDNEERNTLFFLHGLKEGNFNDFIKLFSSYFDQFYENELFAKEGDTYGNRNYFVLNPLEVSDTTFIFDRKIVDYPLYEEGKNVRRT